ncbi:SDR family oxidoreductase [Anaeromicropila herbilytica]|uniref:Short-chain dehydrogenase n=1 Tax=Anaeromicropila herbilytica TaxID=2785025 RepID=A0A7R7EPB0_9FIRM|nr:SDR family oxidoreductase [Anaeromicropila herbilytica]BCN32514.1 short-chain dehydrogenase [Anaeromicropila herbilytica]
MPLVNKKIIITAGCSGLGEVITRYLLNQGATVIPTSRKQESLSKFFESLTKEEQLRCKPMKLLFNCQDNIQNFIDDLKKNNEQIYGLINCAVCRSPILDPFELEIDEWRKHYDCNVFATTFLSGKIASDLMEQGGAIINISSFYSECVPDNRVYDSDTIPTSLIYASSKAALNYITKYFAVKYAKKGIRTNAILAGGIENPSKQSKFFVDEYCKRTPMNRMAKNDEFNHAVKFLLSPENSYCTGQLIKIDGGWSLY